MKEEWKPLKGFENQYLISTHGRVMIRASKKIRKPWTTQDGYLRVSLYKDGEQYNKSIHRLVAETFILNEAKKPQVNHIDGNKINNHYSNLEWVTNQENIDHARENGLYDNADKLMRGCKNHAAKLTNEKVIWIRENKNKLSVIELSKIFKVHHSTICRVINRESWTHI